MNESLKPPFPISANPTPEEKKRFADWYFSTLNVEEVKAEYAYLLEHFDELIPIETVLAELNFIDRDAKVA